MIGKSHFTKAVRRKRKGCKNGQVEDVQKLFSKNYALIIKKKLVHAHASTRAHQLYSKCLNLLNSNNINNLTDNYCIFKAKIGKF